MGGKFDTLQRELHSLGYKQRLHPDSVPLVGKLLGDLKTTTINLEKYIRISQDAIEERDSLELGAEPYKCDNARLLRQCNELHSAFIDFKEQHERTQRDLRSQISELQTKLDNCNLEKNRLIKQIQQFEREKAGSKKGLKSKQSDPIVIDKENKDTMSKEIRDLTQKNKKLLEDNQTLHSQLESREEEIGTLKALLEGGRPYKTVSKECCFRNVESKLGTLKEELSALKKENDQLQSQLKEALSKQHEAMRRAIHLAERNKQLESELKEIDNMALTVEEEANNNMKDSAAKVIRLQERLNESLQLIQTLEQENAKLKQTKLQLTADLEAIRIDKVHLQKQLEGEVEDKKKLTNRINNFTIIENDLNLEIDRLTKLTAKQKQHIIELESSLGDNKHRLSVDEFAQTDFGKMKHPRKSPDKKSSSKKEDPKQIHKKTTKSTKTSVKKSEFVEKETKNQQLPKCCCESSTCIQHLKNLLDKEMEYRQASALQTAESMKQEKEYYMKEYHKLLEQIRNVPSHYQNSEFLKLKGLLEEKDEQIKTLKVEIDNLSRERYNLMAKQSAPDYASGETCNNPLCKRKERELDIVRSDLKHIEMENETLKNKLQAINESTTFNEERMKKAFQDMEAHIRKLETERRDLVQTEVTQRSNLTQLEEDHRNVKEQLKATQAELNHQRANYNQLKLLHEQTDRALTDAQNQVIRAQTELATYQSKMKDSGRESATYEKEIARLNSDVQIMKNQLTKLDREKDELVNQLDEKTEKIAFLEEQLRSKGNVTDRLEGELRELRRKLSKSVEEVSSREQLLRNTQQELLSVEGNYKKEKQQRDAAQAENRRLQSDLASVTCDCREARKELDIAYRQIDDLKRQLQHYVAEIKRTEDLISQKESERNELLDQFKYLSQEANVLESTNHTLESEATQSKIQLSVALDHSSELEKRLENHQSIIQSYERQIAELSNQVASLELQLKRSQAESEHQNTEMRQMRDLCVKLDKEKDSVKDELYKKEDNRSQATKAVDTLRTEKGTLERALEKERSNLQSVEKLLSDARQEAIDMRLLNQDLRGEVDKLKDKVKNLQERLHELKSENPPTISLSYYENQQEKAPRKADRIAYAEPVSEIIFSNTIRSTNSIDNVLDQKTSTKTSIPVTRTHEKFDFRRFYEMSGQNEDGQKEDNASTGAPRIPQEESLKTRRHGLNDYPKSPRHSQGSLTDSFDPTDNNFNLKSAVLYQNENKSIKSIAPSEFKDQMKEREYPPPLNSTATDVKTTGEKVDLVRTSEYPKSYRLGSPTTLYSTPDSNIGEVVLVGELVTTSHPTESSKPSRRGLEQGERDKRSNQRHFLSLKEAKEDIATKSNKKPFVKSRRMLQDIQDIAQEKGHDLKITTEDSKNQEKTTRNHIAYAEPVCQVIFNNASTSTRSSDNVVDHKTSTSTSIPIIRTNEKFDFQRFYEMAHSNNREGREEGGIKLSDIHFDSSRSPRHSVGSRSNFLDVKSAMLYQNDTKSTKSLPHHAFRDIDLMAEIKSLPTSTTGNLIRTHEKYDFRKLPEFPEPYRSASQTTLGSFKSEPSPKLVQNKGEVVKNAKRDVGSKDPICERNVTGKQLEKLPNPRNMGQSPTPNNSISRKLSENEQSSKGGKKDEGPSPGVSLKVGKNATKKVANKQQHDKNPLEKDKKNKRNLPVQQNSQKENKPKSCNVENCWSKMSSSAPVLAKSLDREPPSATYMAAFKPNDKPQFSKKPCAMDDSKESPLESKKNYEYPPPYSNYMASSDDSPKSTKPRNLKNTQPVESIYFSSSDKSKSVKSKQSKSQKAVSSSQSGNSSPSTYKNVNVCTNFLQESDSSAVFRKVFCVDGVGVECCCSISGYKTKTNNCKS